MKQISRFKELTCVVFGHDWSSHGRTSDEQGYVLEEYEECRHCGLRNHDDSGYLRAFHRRNDLTLSRQDAAMQRMLRFN